MQPKSGHFRALCGAAVAYGFTEGGPNAPEINITPLGMRIVRPTEDGADARARREALLKPRVVGEFLQRYHGNPLPQQQIAINVLSTDMSVPPNRAEQVLELILEGAKSVGFLHEIKDRKYVDLQGVTRLETETPEGEEAETPQTEAVTTEAAPPRLQEEKRTDTDPKTRRVYISHGKNKAFIEPIKSLLAFGELEPIVSVERESVSQPVPDKIMGEMRNCGAGIIHVDADQILVDQEAKQHIVLNPNVLIEVGAAMALYGRRFILLVKDEVRLPSNLQGLYEVRYRGETLDGDATIRLLKAINEIKSHPLPER